VPQISIETQALNRVFTNKKPHRKSGANVFYYLHLYSCTILDCLLSIGLLAAKPVNNGNKGKYDAQPIESVRHRVDNVFERPLEAVGYRLKDALKVHG
jgi:hypothetical protein